MQNRNTPWVNAALDAARGCSFKFRCPDVLNKDLAHQPPIIQKYRIASPFAERKARRLTDYRKRRRSQSDTARLILFTVVFFARHALGSVGNIRTCAAVSFHINSFDFFRRGRSRRRGLSLKQTRESVNPQTAFSEIPKDPFFL